MRKSKDMVSVYVKQSRNKSKDATALAWGK